VIVCGHYDTQRTGLLWSSAAMKRLAPLLSHGPPLLQSPFFPVTAAMGVQCLAGALLSPGVGRAVILRRAGAIGFVYAVAAVLLAEWAVGAPVPGASDNASGAAAVLSLGEQWLAVPTARVEVVLLFTGSEEAGLLGAAAWADRHQEEIRSLPTLFLNLDGLGFGAPRFLGREVPIAGLPIAYPAPLVRLCRRLALDVGLAHAGPHTTFGPTDGLAFLARGIPGVAVIGCGDQGQLPHYHQLTDTPERMDFRAAWQGVQFAGRLLWQLTAVAEGATFDE
jgi:peptidase M28-like protein